MTLRFMRAFAVAVLALLLALSPIRPATAAENDRHSGYYYPSITSREVYRARAMVQAEASTDLRLAFVTSIALQQNNRAYPPTFVMFAKGDKFERLIIVAIGNNGFRGLYQARAMLAQLTSIARSTPMFRDNGVEDVLTFLDLARMMGFEELTISDGQSFSHRITFK